MFSRIQSVLDYIEKHRWSKKTFWKILVWLKDLVWSYRNMICKPIVWFDRLRVSFISKAEKDIFIKNIRQEQKYTYSVSLCTTCMNRLSHLKKTLTKNIKDNKDYPKLQFVILDYSSKTKIQDWIIKKFPEEVESGRIKILREDGNEYFHMARAKNIAHYFADGEIVCNVDADNYVGKDFAYYLNYVANRHDSFIAARKSIGYDLKTFKKIPDPLYLSAIGSDFGGRIALLKKDFIKMGGYNEFFSNWGNDDNDFFLRALKLGFVFEIIPMMFFRGISHSDSARVANMRIKKLNKVDKSYRMRMRIGLKNKIFCLKNNFSYPKVECVNNVKNPFEGDSEKSLKSSETKNDDKNFCIKNKKIKNVYLFLAKNHPRVLKNVISRLHSEDSIFIVHIDKRISDNYKIEFGSINENILFLRDRVSINWCGYGYIEATIKMFKFLKENNIFFEHLFLLSDQHWPLMSKKDIKSFFDEANPFALMSTSLIFSQGIEIDKEASERFKYVWNIDKDGFDWSKQKIESQKKDGIDCLKNLNFDLYTGDCWWYMSYKAFDYSLNYINQNPFYLDFMKQSLAPYEGFFQNILMNSEYKDFIINKKINFLKSLGPYYQSYHDPKILDLTDYKDIKKADTFFAYRFDTEKSRYLILKLDNKL